MGGISSLLSTGMKALSASQVGIEVTGQNIANVNTVGYSRQVVDFQDDAYVDANPGQMGTGVRAADIQRMFDTYLESSYNTKASAASRYNVEYTNMSTVETTFNETSTPGVSAGLSQFFQDWQKLSLDPANYPQRQTVLSDTSTLLSAMHQTAADLNTAQQQANDSITQGVASANQLITNIANLNQQIGIHDSPGNNANGLLDQRAAAVRALGQLMDVSVVDHGGANFSVSTQAGQILVDGTSSYGLQLQTNQVVKNLVPGSSFDGNVSFSGADDFEYTVKVVTGGSVTSGAGGAQFQVSLDGGTTWLRSGSGAIETFSARPSGLAVSVGNLSISFGQSSNSSITPTGQLTAGDSFTIVPKTGLFWYGSAATPINITPQTYLNGQDNTSRLTGGSLTGEFNLRDYDIGRYKESLDTLANGVIWETNVQHSQGSGLKMFTDVTGTYQVNDPSLALGSGSSGLHFADKLTSGASMMYIYDATTGAAVSNGFLNFSTSGGLQLFDPHTNSLSDVVAAVNRTFGTYVDATVTNNQLQITAKAGYNFGFGTDATGLYAALGINTLFAGDSARTMTLNPTCGADSAFLNAGQINGTSSSDQGNNQTALNIAALASAAVTLSSSISGSTSQSLSAYYAGLVGSVGTDTANAEFNYNFENSLATDLNNQQQAVSGVNLDEEMSNLVQYQHSYQAAAKIISTADQMWQTVLALKT